MEAYTSTEVGLYLIPKAWRKKGDQKGSNQGKPHAGGAAAPGNKGVPALDLQVKGRKKEVRTQRSDDSTTQDKKPISQVNLWESGALSANPLDTATVTAVTHSWLTFLCMWGSPNKLSEIKGQFSWGRHSKPWPNL